jgi:murein DD-endopeptidase MepM/ murein hydrolase activator NlpD
MVKVGDKVIRGEVIGRLGKLRESTVALLHPS